MTGRSSRHWQVGDSDLPRHAKQLRDTRTRAHVVLVRLLPEGDWESDPGLEDQLLARLWGAATTGTPAGLHGRRLDWRSFVLLVPRDSKGIRDAVAQVSEGISWAQESEPWRVGIHWTESTGDFIEDVMRLEKEANREPA